MPFLSFQYRAGPQTARAETTANTTRQNLKHVPDLLDIFFSRSKSNLFQDLIFISRVFDLPIRFLPPDPAVGYLKNSEELDVRVAVKAVIIYYRKLENTCLPWEIHLFTGCNTDNVTWHRHRHVIIHLWVFRFFLFTQNADFLCFHLPIIQFMSFLSPRLSGCPSVF